MRVSHSALCQCHYGRLPFTISQRGTAHQPRQVSLQHIHTHTLRITRLREKRGSPAILEPMRLLPLRIVHLPQFCTLFVVLFSSFLLILNLDSRLFCCTIAPLYQTYEPSVCWLVRRLSLSHRHFPLPYSRLYTLCRPQPPHPQQNSKKKKCKGLLSLISSETNRRPYHSHSRASRRFFLASSYLLKPKQEKTNHQIAKCTNTEAPFPYGTHVSVALRLRHHSTSPIR